MITSEEIKRKAKRIYSEVLNCALLNQNYFPKTIRANKVLSNNFAEMSKEISAVMSNSKDRKGFGYKVVSRRVRTRNHGLQDIPEAIVFETQEDYLKFTGKVKEFDAFISNTNKIQTLVPELSNWLLKNTQSIIANAHQWDG